MPVYRIPEQHVFPDPRLADPSGLLGVGGDLDPHRVLLAYHLGIFPWYSAGDPICWHSPDPRMVLEPERLHIPRSLGKRIRQRPYRISMDTAFRPVMEHCGEVHRPGQPGTWITPEMLDSYTRLHEMGHAHSIEAWEGETLVRLTPMYEVDVIRSLKKLLTADVIRLDNAGSGMTATTAENETTDANQAAVENERVHEIDDVIGNLTDEVQAMTSTDRQSEQ